MTHDELLQAINDKLGYYTNNNFGAVGFAVALRNVVELCSKWDTKGSYCLPIKDVLKAIEKELQ